MKLRKAILVGLVAILMLGLLPGISSAVELSFRYAFPDGDIIAKALKEFEQKNPGITVKLLRSSFADARDQLVREAAVGRGPDLAHLAFVWIKDLGMAGALMSLNDIVKEKGLGQGWDDFVASNLTYDNSGIFYGVPWATDTWAMVYNRDVLKEAGITKTPVTWEELRDASRQIKKRTGKIGFGFGAGAAGNNSIWFLSNFYWWSDGASLVDQNSAGKYVPGISKEKIVETFKYFDSYLKEGHNPEGNMSVSWAADPQILEPFARGEQGMAIFPLFTYIGFIKDWQKRNPGKALPFYSAATPYVSYKPQTHLGGQSLGINANTKYPNETWKLVKFLTSWEFFQKYYTDYFPAQKSLLKRMKFPAPLKGFQDQFGHARSWGPYATGPAVIGAMWNQTARAFGSSAIGEKSFEQAAQDLLDFVDEQLKK